MNNDHLTLEPAISHIPTLMIFSWIAGGALIILCFLIGGAMRSAGTDVNDEQTQSAASLGVRLHSSLVGAGLFLISMGFAFSGLATYCIGRSPARAVVTGLFPSAAAVAFFIITIALALRGQRALDSGFVAKCWRWGWRFLFLNIIIMLGAEALRALNP